MRSAPTASSLPIAATKAAATTTTGGRPGVGDDTTAATATHEIRARLHNNNIEGALCFRGTWPDVHRVRLSSGDGGRITNTTISQESFFPGQ